MVGLEPSLSFTHTFAILLFLAQFNWTYLADAGRQYNVGLFHGDKTGHLLVYLNAKVIIIDFQVLETKSYSFFIEEELCKIEVERQGERFAYGFKINEEVDTPRNRERKKTEKSNYRKGYWLAGIFFALMLIGSLIIINAYRKQKRELEDRYVMLVKPATIHAVKQRGDTIALRYQLEFQGRKNDFDRLINQKEVNTPFPLEAGDEFNLRFDRFRPSINELNFAEPTYGQLGRYRRRTLEKHLALHPELTRDQGECLVKIAYELKGLDGLADFYFQTRSPDDFPLHNTTTYQKLIRDIPFLDQAEACRIPK